MMDAPSKFSFKGLQSAVAVYSKCCPMNLRIRAVGFLAVSALTIALTALVCNLSTPAHESAGCEAHEVLRSSDLECYVPQGE